MSARFWYWPAPGETAQQLSLGEAVSDFQVTPQAISFSHRTSMRYRRVSYGSWYAVRIVYENFTDEDLAGQFVAMQAHLERGNPVMFALDNAKAWLSFLSQTTLERKSQYWTISPNVFSAVTTASITNGDRAILQSFHPEFNREEVFVGTQTTINDTIILDQDGGTGIRNKFAYASSPIALRHEGFYPALRMPDEMIGTPIITHNHRIAWTLDLTLVEDPELLVSYKDSGESLNTPTDVVDTEYGRPQDIIDTTGPGGGFDLGFDPYESYKRYFGGN